MADQTGKTGKTGAADVAIDIRNVWKIFGSRADEAMQAIQSEGLSKQEVLETYNAVVVSPT